MASLPTNVAALKLKHYSMLTVSVIGMAAYGLYETVKAVADLFGAPRLEVSADLAAIVFGLLLVLAAAFVRVMLPGGLALAISALLALQALAVHEAAHRYESDNLIGQVARALIAATLVTLAYAGGRRPSRS